MGGTDSEKVLVPLKLLKFLRSLLNHVFKRCLPFPQEKKNNSNTHKVRNDNFFWNSFFRFSLTLRGFVFKDHFSCSGKSFRLDFIFVAASLAGTFQDCSNSGWTLLSRVSKSGSLMLNRFDSRSILSPFGFGLEPSDFGAFFLESGRSSCFFSISSNIRERVLPAPLFSWASSALARSTLAVRLATWSRSSLPPRYWLKLCGNIWSKKSNGSPLTYRHSTKASQQKFSILTTNYFSSGLRAAIQRCVNILQNLKDKNTGSKKIPDFLSKEPYFHIHNTSYCLTLSRAGDDKFLTSA